VRARAVLLSALTTLIAIPGCATFDLSKQTGVLPIQKQREATSETLAVCGFRYEPQKSNDTPLDAMDLQKWQSMVVAGIDQASIFGKVVSCSGDEIPAAASYVLDGRITRFRFQKNWVPMFFPLHLGLSFFTFTGYTLFGGPTTMTIVRFAVEFELRKVDTNEVVLSLNKNYRSTRAVNIYSKSIGNPYSNPNMVFAEILGESAMAIAAALPDDPESPADTPSEPPSNPTVEPPPDTPWEPPPDPRVEPPPSALHEPAPVT